MRSSSGNGGKSSWCGPLLLARADDALAWVAFRRRDGASEAEIEVRFREHVERRRGDPEAAYRIHQRREQLAVEFGCVFPDDGDLALWQAARDVTTPALLLGTVEPESMEPTAGLEPSLWSA